MFLLAAVAAICHAGIDRFPPRPSRKNGAAVEPVWDRGTVIPGAGAGLVLDIDIFGDKMGVVEADGWNGGFEEEEEEDNGGSGLVLFVLVPFADGTDVVDEAPTRLPISIFKLRSSVPSSLTRSSPWAFQPSSAFGIISRSPRTSSPSLLDSSSLRPFAALSSSTTEFISSRAESSFSCRCVSASLRAAVSVLSCSIRSNARANEASIEALSDSSCGGVGGTMRGVT